MPLLLLLFIGLPLVEIYVLVLVGRQIGALPTVALVIGSALLGIALLKRQGYQTLTRARAKMAEGVMPAKEMASGIFLAVGGLLLLIPGFVTDVLGLACLIPGVRHLLLLWVQRRLKGARIVRGHDTPLGAGKKENGRTIEGQFRRED